MSLEVTNVEFFHLKKSKVKAFATVTFNKVLTVKGFKIVESDEGLFVGKPSEKSAKDDKWYDNVIVKSKEAWKAIQDAIIAEYEDSDGVNKPRKQRSEEDDEPRKSKPSNNRRDREEDEEAPRKKRRVEEDEEEAPRKRSSRDEDEDEPKPKKKIRRPVEDDDDDNLFN